MKKVLLLVLFLFGIALLYGARLKQTIPLPFIPKTLDPSPLIQTSPVQINHNNQTYSVFIQPIMDPSRLELIPNFSQKILGSEVLTQNGCTYVSNAGFYTADEKPLGLFFVNHEYINSSVHQNTLFNGYVSKNNQGILSISKNPPVIETTDFVFQSGPIIIPNQELSLTQDEEDRRVLLAQSENNFFLLALTLSDNTNSGPTLTDLPLLLSKITPIMEIAINLDGGSASTLQNTETINLGEITYVGSFLCGK